eukprot:tig00000792_g4204.t1
MMAFTGPASAGLAKCAPVNISRPACAAARICALSRPACADGRPSEPDADARPGAERAFSYAPARVLVASLAASAFAPGSAAHATAAAAVSQQEALEADSPLVRELLERSKANKERYERELRDKWYERGYTDYMKFADTSDPVMEAQFAGAVALPLVIILLIAYFSKKDRQ